MLLTMNGIVKRFGGTVALDHACFQVAEGQVHALVGENGSGKSTLMKVLAGIHRADAGEIVFHGRRGSFHTPLAASRAGVAIVHQELNLVPVLSVAENLFLGREPRNWLGMAGFRTMREAARRIFEQLEIAIDPQAKIESLPVAMCQMVEIARALLQRARLLILDEPTSALSDTEVEVLFRVVRRLRAENTSVVYISHKMAEVFALADRYTVLRDGQTVATGSISESTESVLVNSMVGRQLGDYYPMRHPVAEGATEILHAENITRPARVRRKVVNNITFSVCEGEIVGIAGLVGAGRTELLETLFGAAGDDWTGRLRLGGREVRPRSPRGAIDAGIALVTEDRARLGLLPRLSVLANAVTVHLPRLASHGIVSSARERAALSDQSKTMRIRRASDDAPIDDLSGGNQQKVILARWLMSGPRVLLLDEPTRGIDVGAKAEIYRVLRALANQGVGIVFVSSELPEVLGLADRVLVMSGGRIVRDVPAAETTESDLLAAAMSSPK